MQIYMEQRSEVWKELRRTKITSTDAAALLGISPWKSSYDVYLEKMGEAPPFVTNPAIEFGLEKEDNIRAYYEAKTGNWFPPAVFLGEDGMSMASLDGINSEQTRILEIKTCNAKTFEEATHGRVPSYYMSQAQHAMMCVPTVKDVEFVFYHQANYAHVIVDRDNEYISNLASVVKDFYQQCIVNRQPPELTEEDYIIVDEPEALTASEDWVLRKRALDKAVEDEKKAKAVLLDQLDDGNAIVGRVKVTRVSRSSVDYAKMVAELGIDTELYKKPSIGYPKLTIKKSDDTTDQKPIF